VAVATNVATPAPVATTAVVESARESM